MKKADITKAIGGASVMISVFLLIAIASNFNLVMDGAKYAFSDETGDVRQTSLVYTSSRAVAPNGVIEGFFDIERDGDITTSGQEQGKKVIHHYRAIHADQLKEITGQPVLKLQVYNNNNKSWKTTEITKINHEDGTAYFLLKSEEEGNVIPGDYFTGTYQLIVK